jgi:hypothetical protein
MSLQLLLLLEPTTTRTSETKQSPYLTIRDIGKVLFSPKSVSVLQVLQKIQKDLRSGNTAASDRKAQWAPQDRVVA